MDFSDTATYMDITAKPFFPIGLNMSASGCPIEEIPSSCRTDDDISLLSDDKVMNNPLMRGLQLSGEGLEDGEGNLVSESGESDD